MARRGLGLLVAIAMMLMKVVPAIPGHFTVYEWLALLGFGLHWAQSRTAARKLDCVQSSDDAITHSPLSRRTVGCFKPL
jgi:hypothetical protein